MPPWEEGGPSRVIAGLWREEDGGIGAEDLAEPEVRVQELVGYLQAKWLCNKVSLYEYLFK